MPVTSQEIASTYAGNNSTVTPYPITLERNRDEDLKLKVDGVVSTDFTIAVDGFRTGTAIPGTSELVLYRETPLTQEQTFPANTTPAAEDVRAAVDKLTMMSQERAGGLSRALQFPLGESAGDLPSAANRANKGMAFDESGDPTVDEVFTEGEKTKLAQITGDDVILGTELFYGSGAPAVGLGVNENMYMDDTAGVLYRKTAGVWTAIYTPTNTLVHAVTSTPLNSFGSNGDLAIVYSGGVPISLLNKAAGVWGTLASWYHTAHPKQVALVDHFLGGNMDLTSLPGYCGELNWFVRQTVGTGGFVRGGAVIASSTPYGPTIGSIDFCPGTVSGNSIALCFDNGPAAGHAFRVQDVTDLAGMFIEWEFRLSTVTMNAWAGMIDSPEAAAAGPARFVGVRCISGTANFQFQDLNSGSSVQVDSGVAVDTNWHTIRIAHNGTNWVMTLDGLTPTVVTQQVVGSITFGAWVTLTAAGAARMYIDTFRFFGIN